MTTVINTIQETDYVSDSRETINDNFASLNANKQEVEVGKGLSTNDFTTLYKDKLADLVPNYSLTPDLVDSINDTLLEIKGNGGGILYLLPGTYTLTSNINIPTGCKIEGTSRDECIIDCDGSYSVKMEGSDVYDIGDVTIANGDTTLVGSGTTWVSTMVGQHVLIGGYWYEIITFTSGTSLEIEEYDGISLTNSPYVIATRNFNSQISKVTIQNATGAGLSIQYAQEPVVNDTNVYDSGIGIDMDYVVYPIIMGGFDYNGVGLDMNYVEGFYIDYSDISYNTNQGIITNYTRNATLFNSSVNSNGGNGISMTETSAINILGNDISRNGSNGIELISECNENIITGCSFNNSTNDGIKLTATSDRNTFSQVIIKDNGAYGINIVANTCDNNVLIGLIASGNGTGSINDIGTGTLKSPAINILP